MNMSKKVIWGLGLSLLMLATACIEQIEFETEEEAAEFLVINGVITNNPFKRSLFLFQATGFEAGNLVRSQAVEGATIGFYEDGELLDTFEERIDGEYFIPVDERRSLKVGQSYHVEIELATGETFRSTPSLLPPKQMPDSMRIVGKTRNIAQDNGFVVSRRFLDLSIFNTLEPGFRPHFRWEIEQDYSFREYTDPNNPLAPNRTCYFNRSTERNPSPILTTNALQNGSVETFLMASNLGRPFKDVHYFSVYQHSITQEVFEYYEKVNQLINGAGGLFDQIPAPVVGNIINDENSTRSVLGVVEFSTVDTLRFRISRGQLPFTLFEACESFEDPLPECIECIILARATYEKPDFFVN
ncbi:MAG: DUF4249 family protein [Bacteroidota bacterium]